MADGLDAARPAPVPKLVQDFVVYFYRHIRHDGWERNTREIFVMYLHTFPHLSERFFKGSSWPPVEAVSHLAHNDSVFCMLYNELRYRHLHAAVRPTLADRVASWKNYRELFALVLAAPLNLQLPNQWIWDMVDEFVYQFQAFAQYRGSAAGKAPEELTAIAEAGSAWSAGAVRDTLASLAERSGIRSTLSAPGGAEALFAGESYDLPSNVLVMLGYFSLIGLLRVHAVLGDFAEGMRAMQPLNPFVRRHLFATKIAMANITLFYYASFAYLMMQRYLDAGKCLNFILSYIVKVKTQAQRAPGYDQILKKNEQLYALLAITTAMCPAVERLTDEAVQSLLREKYGEKLRILATGAPEVYEELFAYACPKFVSALPADPSASGNSNAEAYRAQLAAFSAIVESQRGLPALKQFMRLYTSISLRKLAGLAELDEAALRQQLELLHRSAQIVTWSGGDALEGAPQPAGDLDFAIERGEDGTDMVVVSEARTDAGSGSAFLIQHIQKLQSIVSELEALQVPQAATA